MARRGTVDMMRTDLLDVGSCETFKIISENRRSWSPVWGIRGKPWTELPSHLFNWWWHKCTLHTSLSQLQWECSLNKRPVPKYCFTINWWLVHTHWQSIMSAVTMIGDVSFYRCPWLRKVISAMHLMISLKLWWPNLGQYQQELIA